MAHTLRVGCDRREFRVTARGDKPLRSVARSIAKRLGCSRVSLFANARVLDESLTVGAVVASGVGRVEAVPCDVFQRLLPEAWRPKPFFAATRAFSEYFTPEDDPELVVCTFTGGGQLHDYTMMDAMVALTAAYRAEGKSIEFHSLRPSSVRMMQKVRACKSRLLSGRLHGPSDGGYGRGSHEATQMRVRHRRLDV